MSFTNLERQKHIDALTNKQLEVLVIGGGITGAGIALDASTRGMSVGLVEMQDFAAGTSSRSTKLVHGGLRYLKQLQVGLVAEVGKERAVVYENGPHVTTPEWMLLPFHQGGTFGSFSTSIGLRVYDFLAGVKKAERRKMLSVDNTIGKAPLIKKEGLKGGGYYVEYRTDDARLTMEVMKEAHAHGANLLNYAKVEELLYDNGTISGVRIKDLLSGEFYSIFARKVINAAGPWVDTIREKDNSKKGKVLQMTKGVHIVIDQSKFPLKQAVYFDTPDGRMVFAIPREGKTYVGTTDTFYNIDPIHPKMTEEDRAYLLKAIRYMFPSLDLTGEDVESSWAGVRPLIYEEGKNASEISRKDETWVSDSGLITIAGGKLTGYRKMAETIVDLIAKQFKDESYKHFDGSQTKHLPISGGHVGGAESFDSYKKAKMAQTDDTGLSAKEAEELLNKYGSNAPILFDIARNRQAEAKEYGLPLPLYAKLAYAIEYEMCITPMDFFNRRTSMILFDIDTVKAYKEKVIRYMQSRLNWSPEQTEQYKTELEEGLHDAANPAVQEQSK